jgi:hypothetical protein
MRGPTRSNAEGPTRQKQGDYPHFEQNKYSIPSNAAPDVRTANSSLLPATICNAAMQGVIFLTSRLGFSCECINSV